MPEPGSPYLPPASNQLYKGSVIRCDCIVAVFAGRTPMAFPEISIRKIPNEPA